MTSFAIIGAGPAGLSIGRLLADAGHEVSLFERDGRIGGKSWTILEGSTVAELGTCYVTPQRQLDKWFNRYDVETSYIGEQRYDGEDFFDYVRAAGGQPLALQVLRFAYHARRFLKRMQTDQPDADTLSLAARPIQDWLRARNLPMIERIMHRSLTVMGYGYVDETPTLQALRWVTFDLLLTGYRNKLRMPTCGWSEFWSRLSADLDIRLRSHVQKITRSADGVTVHTSEGEMQVDQVICAIPPGDFAELIDASPDEHFIASGIEWQSFTSGIIAAEGWFTESDTEGYSAAVEKPDGYGRILGARKESFEPELGGHIYLTVQSPGPYSEAELAELVRADIAQRGGHVTNIIDQKTWRYFPRYTANAIRGGITQKMRDVQGQNRTWYTGAAFSFEAVSHIISHNEALARHIAQALTTQRSARP